MEDPTCVYVRVGRSGRCTLFVTNCGKLERDHENNLKKVDVLEKLERDHESNLNKVDVLFRSYEYKHEAGDHIVGVGGRRQRLELFPRRRP
jgi:hypothetical protein